jgi:hypothetical protein
VVAGEMPGGSTYAAPFRQPAAWTGAATQPAAIKKATAAGNIMNFI